MKVATIAITSPKIEDLYQRLVIREERLKFPLYKGRVRTSLLLDPAETDGDEEHDEQLRYDVVPGDLEVAGKSPPELERSLYRLSALARSSKEERGINTLYLALGMLAWRPVEGAGLQRAPLLLIPVELTREDRFSPYVLSMFDEDPEVNPTLVYMLRRDFDFSLPAFELDIEGNGDELIAYLLQVQEAVGPQGWDVEDAAWLGQFNFKRLAMYRDLESHEQTAAENRHVLAIAGLGTFEPEPDVARVEEFDQLPPSEVFTILDADHSQVEILLRARSGQDLIIQGPPGTGKSQTITNLIAQFLFEGKKVLFVSEKMAALSIVHGRLEQVGIGPFCLEIHSDKANKRDTLARIERAWNYGSPQLGQQAQQEFDELLALRRELNDYARELHEPALHGRSAFELHAELAGLDSAPQISSRLQLSVGSLTPNREMELRRSVQRLARLPSVLRGYARHPWRGCTLAEWSIDQQEQLRTRLGDLSALLRDTHRVACDVAAGMNAPAAECLADFDALLRLAQYFASSPCPPIEWFSADISALRLEAGALAEKQARYRQLRSDLLAAYTPDVLGIEAGQILADLNPDGWRLPLALRESSADLDALTSNGRELLRLMRRVVDDGRALVEAAAQVAGHLGQPKTADLESARVMVQIAELVAQDPRPATSWFEAPSLSQVEAKVRACSEKHDRRTIAIAELRQRFMPTILEFPFSEWKADNEGRYRHFFRFLYPGFRRRYRALEALRTDSTRMDFGDFCSAVELGAKVREIDDWFNAHSEDLATELGPHYRGIDSDWPRVENALACMRQILDVCGGNAVPEGVRNVLLAGANRVREVARAASRARQALDALDTCLPPLASQLDLKMLADSGPAVSEIDSLVYMLASNADRLERFLDRLDELQALLKPGVVRRVDEILTDVSAAGRVTALERETAEAAEALSSRYQSFFRGLETDWGTVISALDWIDKFNDARLAVSADYAILRAAIDLERVKHVAASTGMLSQLVGRLGGAVAFLPKMFARDAIPGDGAIERIPAIELADWVDLRIERIGELSEWVQFQSAKADAEKLGLGEFVAEALRRSVEPPQLEAALRRQLLVAQLDEVYRQRPRLRDFNWRDQEDLVNRFRSLDRRLMVSFSRLVQARVKQNQPDRYAPAGGQLAFLRRELTKQRRHASLRRLFEQAGEVILDITPCLLMSPLSVATHLPKDAVRFDVIIFDEASQIPAEEAVGAIVRGNQLIVAGDSKQLPPTRFFERSFDYDDLIEDDEEEPLESVLEDCSAASMQRCMLEWHYRSRHESLIAFSNAEFYDSRLVTFPTPSVAAPEGMGVRFEYVEDGLYDRAGTSTNRAEARRVASLVERHFAQWGTERSLGVIALSAKQAEAIEDEVRVLLERRPDLEPLLRTQADEPFFVKPLENVQGDERDVIILSIGYGRKAPGEPLSHNFGPINHEGGERRLNVAVTRAKWELVLVASILGADIDETRVASVGPRALKRYLDYAREGRLPPETRPPTGEAESWFEERVWEALDERGIAADRNVGVSRYRIDLAVRHPSHPGHYMLGIECDGATYHSSKLARDRDRLRQQVLEERGWEIHRIWSTDWIRDKRGCLERLMERIESLSSEPVVYRPPMIEPGERTPEPSALPDIPELAHWEDDQQACPTQSVSELYPEPFGRRYPRELFEADNAAAIRRAVVEVVRHEGPIHENLLITRVRSAFGIQRTGNLVEGKVKREIARAVREGSIARKERFLWPAGEMEVTFRVPRPGTKPRSIEQVPPEEIDSAVLQVIKNSRGIQADDAVPEARKLLGYERARDQIKGAIEAAVQRLLASGQVIEQGGFLRLAR